MADAPLAPPTSDEAPNEVHTRNPFATPVLDPIDLPALPRPVAQPVSTSRHTQSGDVRRPTTLYGDVENEKVAYAYKSESMSSTGGSSLTTPISVIDLEQDAMQSADHKKQRTINKDRPSRDRRNLDPEKGGYISPRRPRNSARGSDSQRIAYLEDDDMEETRQMQEQKALNILLFLSGPCVILSFLNAMWTLLSLMIVTLAQPVRICARRPTFGQQLGGLLGPALNLQLKSIYTPLPPHADEDTTYNSGTLVTVQLLSPFLSLGLMLAGWVVAIFWISSMIVGDPSGTDKGDDGRETVLSLRTWWERWLVRCVKED